MVTLVARTEALSKNVSPRKLPCTIDYAGNDVTGTMEDKKAMCDGVSTEKSGRYSRQKADDGRALCWDTLFAGSVEPKGAIKVLE